MIILDTSLLVDSLTGPRRSAPRLRRALELGERILVPTLVLYEWLRGPRMEAELEAQEALFPRASSPVFGAEEAELAASLYAALDNPRGREVDIAIAAIALAREARLWTLNVEDFEDLPRLEIYSPEAEVD